MRLSIVSTLFESAPYLAEFHRRASTAAAELTGDDYEIVLVNDGSPDGSLDMAIRLSEVDSHMVIVDLSRNFGHHKAMMTGLAHAVGDRVFLIDADLEEDPAWLSPFAAEMDRQDVDVVYGVQKNRNDKAVSRWAGAGFYHLFRLMTRLSLPDNVVVARLMSRRYVNALLLHDEREVFMLGLWIITGFRQFPLLITKTHKGKTSYTFHRKLSLFVNSVTSFSSAPLIGIFVSGVAISILAVAYMLFLVVNWFFFHKPASGWTSVIASVWLLGGINTAFLGVIGIYVSKIFSETKRRPYTIVRHIYGKKS